MGLYEYVTKLYELYSFYTGSVVGTYQWKVILERMWGRTDK